MEHKHGQQRESRKINKFPNKVSNGSKQKQIHVYHSQMSL